MFTGGSGDEADTQQTCRPLYQSATVDVFARFVTADSTHGSPPYMLHRKALFRLTDLVRDRIQMSNNTVARLRSGRMVIDGLRPGRTEIQVTVIFVCICKLIFLFIRHCIVSGRLCLSLKRLCLKLV